MKTNLAPIIILLTALVVAPAHALDAEIVYDNDSTRETKQKWTAVKPLHWCGDLDGPEGPLLPTGKIHWQIDPAVVVWLYKPTSIPIQGYRQAGMTITVYLQNVTAGSYPVYWPDDVVWQFEGDGDGPAPGWHKIVEIRAGALPGVVHGRVLWEGPEDNL